MSPPVIVFSTSWFGVRILPEGKKKRQQRKHVHWEVGQLVRGAPELSSYSIKYRVATKVHNEKTTSIGWVSESRSEPGWFTGQFFARKLVFISYCKKCQLKLWCGIRATVAALLLCVNCQLLQHWSFCFFGLSFIIQQQCWRLYVPWRSYDGSKILGFVCWCFVLFLNLSKSLCCAYQIWVVCFDWLAVACCACFMFLELLELKAQSINANGRFIRRDFEKPSIEFWLLQCGYVAMWFLFLGIRE